MATKDLHIGYKLSSEEHGASELVRFARAAEERGFSFAMISDHFHPWTDREGESPFVWSVLGAVAQATRSLRVGTAVTCPTIRIHPALVAQAAATTATMMPGRFLLGVGTGEKLNEHVVGARWPEADVRREMLAEAVEVIRLLWQGGLRSHHGKHFTVENARLYSLPDEPPPLLIAAGGPKSATLAGVAGDGLVCAGPPQEEVLDAFDAAGGEGKPRYGELTVCWAGSEEEGRRLVREMWPIAGLPGPLQAELPVPSHFEAAAALVTDESVSDVPVGPDPERHVQAVREYAEGGYDHVFIHQVGPDQDGFLDFYAREVLPRLV